MAVKPGSGGDRDFVTIFKTGSVDHDDYLLILYIIDYSVQTSAPS